MPAAASTAEPQLQGLGAYRRVLASPRVIAMVTASLLARVTVGIALVTLVIFVHGTTGSFADAGVVAAAYTVGLGLTGPLLARVIDRRGSDGVVLPAAIVAALALTAVALLGEAGLGAAPLALGAALAGGATPPVSGVMRQWWPTAVEPRYLSATYALDAVLNEVAFVVGPLLAGLLILLAGAGGTLVIGAVVGVTGTAWFATGAHIGPSPAGAVHHGLLGALSSPAVRLLTVTGAPLGATFGALNVVLPAFGAAHDNTTLGGPLIAAISVGAVLGGIAYGALRRRPGPPARDLLVLSLVQVVVCLPLLLAESVAEMFVGAALSGVIIAPLLAARYQLGQERAPAAHRTEAFTWLSLSVMLGISGGSAFAGLLVQAGGWRAGGVAAVACAALAAAWSLAGHRRLDPPAPVAEPRRGNGAEFRAGGRESFEDHVAP